MKFIDLFCGIGGFRIGFERNGGECVFSSDFNPKVQMTYEMNYGEKPYGDITKVIPKDIPNFDVLLGGFPCQPFSISGKKLGFEDTRGTLFFDICRIIEVKKPKVVVLENVQHLVNHDKKRTFKTIIKSLESLGYNVNFKILNCIDFGLPQNRERIFIVGTKYGFFDFEKIKINKSKPLKYFLDKKGDFEYLEKDEYTLLDKKYVKQQKDSGLIFCGYRNKNGFQVGIRPNSQHLNRVHRQPNRIYSVDGYHPTIPSQETSGRFFIYLPDQDRVRKLTINECYRIMGFPKDYKQHPNLSERYKQIGNSVSVSITEQISKQIIEQNLLEKTNVKSQRKVVGDLRELYFQ
jgi:DNA (cytosine-5)-methyltransferase 1